MTPEEAVARLMKKREKQAEYYRRHSEERKEYARQYYQQNKDEILDRLRLQRAAGKKMEPPCLAPARMELS